MKNALIDMLWFNKLWDYAETLNSTRVPETKPKLKYADKSIIRSFEHIIKNTKSKLELLANLRLYTFKDLEDYYSSLQQPLDESSVWTINYIFDHYLYAIKYFSIDICLVLSDKAYSDRSQNSGSLQEKDKTLILSSDLIYGLKKWQKPGFIFKYIKDYFLKEQNKEYFHVNGLCISAPIELLKIVESIAEDLHNDIACSLILKDDKGHFYKNLNLSRKEEKLYERIVSNFSNFSNKAHALQNGLIIYSKIENYISLKKIKTKIENAIQCSLEIRLSDSSADSGTIEFASSTTGSSGFFSL